MGEHPEPFSDAQAVARYAEGPPRIVPGFEHLHRMTTLLLAERVPRDGRVLVVGAGGGLELRALAESHAEWTFDGVDPSAEMIRLAAATLGPMVQRARLHVGYVESAPTGPFDGATCLLTLHFVSLDGRRRMLREIHRRLKPRAPFIVAHMSFPQAENEHEQWLSRYVSFAAASGIDREKAEYAKARIAAELPIIEPAQDEAMLREAGFTEVSSFYAGFVFRGWVAYSSR